MISVHNPGKVRREQPILLAGVSMVFTIVSRRMPLGGRYPPDSLVTSMGKGLFDDALMHAMPAWQATSCSRVSRLVFLRLKSLVGIELYMGDHVQTAGKVLMHMLRAHAAAYKAIRALPGADLSCPAAAPRCTFKHPLEAAS